MRVDGAVLGLVFSGISALVVVIGAFAAVRQIQHLRRGNELAAIAKFVDEWSSNDFAADRRLVREELNSMLEQFPSMDDFRADPRAARVFRVLHFFERLAFFVRQGAISEEVAMELFASAAIAQWEMSRDFVVRLRAHYRTQTPMEWFEDFAMRAPEWYERNERRSKRLRRDPKAALHPAESGAFSPPDSAHEGVPAPEA